uniref:Uncharacterized protein n=1 Tax=Cucumis melo TaxID=3656 RepID=A0A9I9CKA5_CUCME
MRLTRLSSAGVHSLRKPDSALCSNWRLLMHGSTSCGGWRSLGLRRSSTHLGGASMTDRDELDDSRTAHDRLLSTTKAGGTTSLWLGCWERRMATEEATAE